MIEVKDRVPARPNRIRIVPENGTPFYATWERADEPIEEGTPVNKLLFDSIDEGAMSFSPLDDFEMEAQRVTTSAGWTTVTFRRPFSGIPRILASVSNDYIISVQNVTRTGCQIAVKQLATTSFYAASSSGGNVTKSIAAFTGLSFVAASVDIAAIYDGGVSP